MTTGAARSILDLVRSAHDIIEMLPDDVHAEVIDTRVAVFPSW